MTGPSARSWTYVAVALAAPFIALALGDPGPVIVALPAAVLVVVGLLVESGTPPEAVLTLDTDRTTEQGTVQLRIEIRGVGSMAHVGLGLPVGMEVRSVEGGRRVGTAEIVLPMTRGEAVGVVRMAPTRWGIFRLGKATVVVAGPLRMRHGRVETAASETLVVMPDEEKVHRLAEPLATNMHAGDLVSRNRGSGVEFAELRPWSPGDPNRAINWRASARSDYTWVTERHHDRNGDLIIVGDSIVEPGSDVGAVVRQVTRIAGVLVRAYGQTRHRLGLLDLGGRIRWFGLASGPVQEHRLLEALLETQLTAAPVWMAVDRTLERAVRPPSMVIFVSALLDPGVVGRIRNLAISGIDVAVVAVDPSGWMHAAGSRVGDLSRRVWLLERQAAVSRLRQAGVGVGEWHPGRSLADVVGEVDLWRRRLRRVRA